MRLSWTAWAKFEFGKMTGMDRYDPSLSCSELLRTRRRELLFGLNAARERLLQSAPDAPETVQVNAAYMNLIRMWSDI